ncbi:CBS domain containing protein [Streptococcus pneumoniae]|nr:CBS domain containing protein [Streptococcus pneumoniae]CWA08635.1 CBS domain containing protein [Streptococcus pneumoniae]
MAVKDFMTRKVVYISPDTTVSHAADFMTRKVCTVCLLSKMIN